LGAQAFDEIRQLDGTVMGRRDDADGDGIPLVAIQVSSVDE
jgi:hypothetical protein